MNQKGFSLIELLAVIVLMSTIATIGFFSINKLQEAAKLKILVSAGEQIKGDIVNFMIAHRPVGNELMIDLIPQNALYADIMVNPKDPWNQPTEKVYATVLRENQQLYIDVYFQIKGRGCYVLYEGSSSVYRTSALCTIP